MAGRIAEGTTRSWRTRSGWSASPDEVGAAHTEGGDAEAAAAEDLSRWLAQVLLEERQALRAALEKIHLEGQAALDEEMGRRHGVLAARLQGRSRVAPHACGAPDDCLPGAPAEGDVRGTPCPARESRPSAVVVLQELPSRDAASSDDDTDRKDGGRLVAARSKASLVQKRVDTILFEGKKSGSKWRLNEFVEDPRFELLMAVLILLNGLQMAFEVQQSGLTRGYDLGYRDYANNPDPWPGSENIWNVLGIFFGVAFTSEVSLKIFALRARFFKSCWNLFDLIVVLCFLVEMSAVADASLKETTALRLARLARLLRLVRVVGHMESFGTLWLMTTSLQSSAKILAWSCLLLMITQALVAFLINRLLDEFYFGGDHPQEEQKEVFAYFGSFSRALVSTFEMTLANWTPVCRLLMENVSEWYMVICLFHKLTVGFAVVGVINGIFIQETFRLSAQDDFVMCYRKESAAQVHRVKMERLLQTGDANGDGYLQRDEFLQLVQNAEVQVWLAAMGLAPSDGDDLFDFMDVDKDNKVSVAELIQGVDKLKGAARSLDLMIGLKRQEELHQALRDIHPEIDQRRRDRCSGPAVANEFFSPPVPPIESRASRTNPHRPEAEAPISPDAQVGGGGGDV